MTAAQLRQSILQAAVQGKLVPQDPNDEPATELLKRIAKEKIRWVKMGKTKRQPSLPDIDEGQTPFDLPPGWTWGRFPELGVFGRGRSKHRPRNDPALFDDGEHPMIQTGDVAKSKGIIKTYTGKYNNIGLSQSLKWQKGTMCITIAANIADSGILSFDACFPDSIVGFIPASLFENARYFEYFIRTAKSNLSEFAPATAQKNINLEILTQVLIPLPPLAEQQRIVAKVDELMALCDELEAAEKELDTLERDFAEHLPKSILQAAVQGKLVPQNVHDEPASALLEHIRAEKSKLIKQGKLKKEKPLPSITEDEVPYDLPNGWVWCRLNDVCKYIQRGRSPKYSELKEVPVLSQKCVQWGKVTLDKARFIEPATLNAYGEERFLKPGDLLWNSTGHGTLGRIAQFNIRDTKYPKIVADSHVTVIRGISDVDSRYLLCWLSGPTVQDEIVGKSSGSTNQIELATSTIMSYLVPLPPLAEQQRIIAKVDELMALCNELKVAEELPIAPAQPSTIIPFPTRATALEKPAVEEEEYLIAARGDLQEKVSAAHRQARRKAFED